MVGSVESLVESREMRREGKEGEEEGEGESELISSLFLLFSPPSFPFYPSETRERNGQERHELTSGTG